MGLSSSQARLLNLTTRMHQIEYKAAKLEAQKLQMANESKRVYLDYQNAMEKTKIQLKSLTTNASVTFIDATYNILKAAGYRFYFTSEIGDFKENNLLNPINQVTSPQEIPEGYTAINSVEDLMNISNGNYILMADIDLAGVDWVPIGFFTGTLDGNGHTIKNLNSNSGGLFGYIGADSSHHHRGATIKNLSVTDANISIQGIGSPYGIRYGSAGILGNTMSSNVIIDNCYVSGTVFGGSAGGMIGTQDGAGVSTIMNSSADINVTGSEHAGGLIGNEHYGISIINSHSTGQIAGTEDSTKIGGLVAECCNAPTIENSYSTCTFSGNGDIGGIIGLQRDDRPEENNRDNVYYVGDDNYTDNPSNEGVSSITPSELEELIAAGILNRNGAILTEEQKNSTEWLTNMILGGYLILQKPDSKGEYMDVSVATDTDLQEVADESDLRKAEAKYEADMRRIDYKDRKYDYDLSALEAERNAIKNEMETLKTVARDNVERTFKLFG